MSPAKKRQLQLDKQQKTAQERTWERCECCKELKPDVKRRIDPYAAEMDDNKLNGEPSDPIYMNSCSDCFHQRAGEV